MNRIRNAYDLARRLYTFRFQGSGKPFVSHGVGTASVLCNLQSPAELVAAGLIHNVYTNGDFGYLSRKGVTNAKRRFVKNAVGEEVEQYIYRLRVLRSGFRPFETIAEHLNNLDLIDRSAVLLKLADQVDIFMDRGVLYYSEPGVLKQYLADNGGTMIMMAENLGYPTLAAMLKEVINETLTIKIPTQPKSKHPESHSHLVIPRSFRRRFTVAFYRKFINLLMRLRAVLRLQTRIIQLFVRTKPSHQPINQT